MKNNIKFFAVFLILSLFALFAIASGNPPKAPNETTATTSEEYKIMEDGFIQETNIFILEEQLKGIDKYNWSEEHGVIEGRTGYLGTVYCEENDIWCDLSGNNLEEITIASIKLHKDDFDLLLTFVSFFETSLIDSDEAIEWIKNYSVDDGFVSKNFGDAEFYLEEDTDEGTIKLSIHALE